MFYFLLTLLLSAPVYGGFVVTAKLSQGGTESPLKQFYQAGNTKIEFRSSPSSDTSLIYRGGSGTLSWIDHGKKSFLEASEQDLSRLAGIFSAFRRDKSPAPTEVTLKKTGDVTVGKWKCTRYSVLAGGKKTGHLCVVPLTQVGATPADFKPLVSLAKTMNSLGFIPPEQRGYLGTVERAFGLGFMVESESFDGAGKTLSKMRVEKITQENLGEATFGNPVGYQRNDLTSLLQQQLAKPSGK